MVKVLITVQLTRKLSYFCDIHHFKIITRIMIDNIMAGQAEFQKFHSFYNTYKHIPIQTQHKAGLVLLLFLTMPPV